LLNTDGTSVLPPISEDLSHYTGSSTPTGFLPYTGSNLSSMLALLGMSALAAGGFFLVLVSRRKRYAE